VKGGSRRIRRGTGGGAARLRRVCDRSIADTGVGDPGIVRHRGKIEATIAGARAYLDIEEREGFSDFCWEFVDGAPIRNRFATQAEVPAETPLSRRFSKALKARGFRFCGPTIVYAWMEATGMVNDHLVTCPRHAGLGE